MIDWSPIAWHAGRTAVCFSGGKDSTIILWMLREAGMLSRVTVYHLDTGDLLPDMAEHVAALREWCPHFITVRTDPKAWAAIHGEPTDLLPYTSHEVGQLAGEGRKLSTRYACCFANLMFPIYERVHADGNTLLIRGTRRADMERLPAQSGDTLDGMEFFYPLQEWSDADVFAFIEREGVPLPKLYEHFRQSPECATCPAWWKEGRGPYLRANHPELYVEYYARVSEVAAAINDPLRAYKAVVDDLAAHELGGGDGLVIHAAAHPDIGLLSTCGAESLGLADNPSLSGPVGQGAFVHDSPAPGADFYGASGAAGRKAEGEQNGNVAHV